MSMFKTYQQQLQDMVNKGIDAAEKQQNRLVSMPFDMAEKLEENGRTHSVKSLRKTYNGYSENMFDQLRELNVKMGEFTDQLLSFVDKEESKVADSALEVADSAVESVDSAVAETAEDVEVAAESVDSEFKAEYSKLEGFKPAKARAAKAEENVSA